jgi:hypothetical protein
MKPRRKKKSRTENPENKVPVKGSGSKFTRLKQWCLGTVLGLIVLSVIGNHISAVIPNPFRYLFNRSNQSVKKKEVLWYATGIKNGLKHFSNFSIWNNEDSSWHLDGYQPGETKWIVDIGPMYLSIAGDMIMDKEPRMRFHQTYQGPEIYELELKTFDHKPSDDELREIKPNIVTEILGGPWPKTLEFVDGASVTFDVFGPTGIKLKTIMPINGDAGPAVYPFQIPKEEKSTIPEK